MKNGLRESSRILWPRDMLAKTPNCLESTKEDIDLSSMAMAILLRRMKVNALVHGFRSVFCDWAADCTGYSHEVAEMALAHTIRNAVERAYRRGDLFDKWRQLMAEWAAYCAGDALVGRTADAGNAA
jgi:hypothetical protein